MTRIASLPLRSLLHAVGSTRRLRMRLKYRMLVDLRVPEQREAWRTGSYEDRLIALARSLVPGGGTFLDVGANVGFYACGVGIDVLARGGSLYAFEPVSSNRRRLERNLALNRLDRRVPILPFALGDTRGSIVMRRRPAGAAGNAVGQNMLSEWDRAVVDREGWVSEEVELSRLDDWSPVLARCDVVKIDVEGADLLVLRGGTATLERFRPVVIAEFNPYWMRQIGQDLNDVRRFSSANRYRLFRLFGDRFLPLPADHADGDGEVPSYVLLPEERAGELAGNLG